MIRDFSKNPNSLGNIKCVIPVITGTLIACDNGVIYRNQKQQEVCLSWETFNIKMFNNYLKKNVR